MFGCGATTLSDSEAAGASGVDWPAAALAAAALSAAHPAAALCEDGTAAALPAEALPAAR